VVGEYQFSGSSNTSTNRACLNFEFVSTSNYLSLAAFEEDVLGLPEMVGKTIQFQAHVVASETVEN
jgi:hypothetical protein